MPDGAPGERLTPNAPIEAFGGGEPTAQTSAAIGGIGKATEDIGQKEKEIADNSEVVDRVTKLINARDDIMYNPKSGVVTKTGVKAAGSTQQAMSDFNDVANDLMGSLSNDAQRRSFQNHVLAQSSQLRKDALVHESGETRKSDISRYDALVAAQQDDAELHYQDPDLVEIAKESQIRTIADKARYLGTPQSEADLQGAQAISTTNTRIINRMLANDQDQAAKSYYTDVKQAQDSGVEKYGFTGQDIGGVERALEIGSTRGESARSVDQILNQKGIVDPATGLIDGAAAMAEVKKIPDQKIQDAARVRMQEEISQAKQNLASKQEQNFLQAAQIARDPSNAGKRITDILTPAMLAGVNPEQYSALERMPKDIPNDDKAWVQFETIPPQQLAKMSQAEFMQWQSKFSTPNRGEALKQYHDAVDWMAKNGQTDFVQTLNFKERVDETLRGYEKRFARPQTDWNQDDFTDYANVLRAADRNVRAAAQAKKGPLNGDEMQKAIDDVFTTKFKTNDWFGKYSNPTPAALMGKKPTFKDIPDADKQSYSNYFKSLHNQKAPSDDQVQRMHQAALMGDRRLFETVAHE